MTRNDLVWHHKRGRDRDGDLFDVELLVHDNGRIMGVVVCPVSDEYMYRVTFYSKVSKAIEDECPRFIALNCAKEFLIATVVASQAG